MDNMREIVDQAVERLFGADMPRVRPSWPQKDLEPREEPPSSPERGETNEEPGENAAASASPDSTSSMAPEEETPSTYPAATLDGHLERCVPGMGEAVLHYHHFHRYAFAQGFVEGKDVLDLACGEGYGAALLASKARSVSGVDRDERCLAAARAKYGRTNLDFQPGDMTAIPYDDAVFDVVVCFEAIEHIEEQERCLREIRRVLKPEGLLILSSPKPAGRENENPFHLRELSREELMDLLQSIFPEVRLFGQKITVVSGIWPEKQAKEGESLSPPEEHFFEHKNFAYRAVPAEARDPDFYMALAGRIPERAGSSYLVDRSHQAMEMSSTVERLHEDGCRAAVSVIKAKARTQARFRLRVEELAGELSGLQRLYGRSCEQVRILSQGIRRQAVRPLNPWDPDRPLKARKISVVIPVRNGGPQLSKLLGSLRGQQGVPELEILVVDSASTDQSVQAARAAGARVFTIEPSRFSHGGTRDRAGRAATGDLILFMVQDALPSSDRWLASLAGALEANPELAVISARQAVSDDAPLYNRIQGALMKRYFAFDGDVSIRLEDPRVLDALDGGTRRNLTFVDNVCACMPREVFLRYGFKNLKNAEDIDLGARLVKAGETLGFLDSAPVIHWHDREPAYFFKRYFIGVESIVQLLDVEPLDLAGFGIVNETDMTTCLRSFLEAVTRSLRAWRSEERRFEKGLSGWFRTLYDTITVIEREGEPLQEKGGGDPSLDRLLERIVDLMGGRAPVAPRLSNNPLVPRLTGELRDIAAFLTVNRVDVRACPDEFEGVIYRTAGSILGDLLGNFVMFRERSHAGENFEAIRRILEDGVCRANP